MITGAILTHNNEEQIEEVLKDLSFCSEILVIDNESSDRTSDIAKANGARVISTPDVDRDNFAVRRNMAMEKAAHSWILFLDTDEKLDSMLKNEIIRMVEQSAKDEQDIHVAYRLKRKDFFWGKEMKYGETMSARTNGIVRLVKKEVGHWSGKVHEIFNVDNEGRNIGSLDGFIHHYPHPSIKEFLNDVNYYSSVRATELQVKKTYVGVFDMVMRPCLKFFYTYGVKLGFLDGAEGFVYSFMMSFHSFLSRGKAYMSK